MTTIVEPAPIEIWPELGETPAQCIRVHAPGPDLSQAWGIDDVSHTGDGQELRGGRGVFARAPLLADRTHPELEPRFQRIEQARLPDARPAGEDGLAATQQVAHSGEALVRFDGRHQHLIARGSEALRKRLGDRRVELVLVD